MSDLLRHELERKDLTWADIREIVDIISDAAEEWHGLPVPIGMDTPLVLQRDHPKRAAMIELGLAVDLEAPPAEPDPWVIRNHWIDRQRNREVYVLEEEGRIHAEVIPIAPDRSMERLTLAMTALSAIDAWDLEAEYRAREKLRGMLTEHQWRCYDLTGSFMEASKRSGLHYFFRRLRPTVVLTSRSKRDPAGSDPENPVRVLAVLCLHPVGYYHRTYAGCMVPTDDLIAHLTMMRADEAHFWAKANQHNPASPEAGL